MSNVSPLLLVNFGGPRTLDEIEPFLKELLCDREVVRTKLPRLIHNYLFQRIAKKRAQKIKEDYEIIGGGSPIFYDTEYIAEKLREKGRTVFTFHRYLPDTHPNSLDSIQQFLNTHDTLTVFPLFPQFTYATTGSIAKLFCQHLPKSSLNRLRWIKSYSIDQRFIELYQKHIEHHVAKRGWALNEVFLFFSAHGVPQKFIQSGDPYQRECEEGYLKIMSGLRNAEGCLAYQSQFGKEEWIKPYTIENCERIHEIVKERKKILFIPLSFTSDHIETLFEVEHQYLPILKKKGFEAERLPAFNREPKWIELIDEMVETLEPVYNCMLVRCGGKSCC